MGRVTVQPIGFPGMRQLVDRYNLRMFHRVTKVVLRGPNYKQDLLPELAKFTHLQELELNATSIPEDALETWKENHPRVVVKATYAACIW